MAGSDKPVGFYSLDGIISVGHSVKSPEIMHMIGSVSPAAEQASAKGRLMSAAPGSSSLKP